MHEHRGRYGGAIMLGIGAAFDVYAGSISRAPNWMQKYGLIPNRVTRDPPAALRRVRNYRLGV
jgi:exopolysaccharide biosynthesis WecB/TagA/CpsF family protein